MAKPKGNWTGARARILAHLESNGERTLLQLYAAKLCASYNALAVHLTDMVAAGKVRRVSRGIYALPGGSR